MKKRGPIATALGAVLAFGSAGVAMAAPGDNNRSVKTSTSTYWESDSGEETYSSTVSSKRNDRVSRTERDTTINSFGEVQEDSSRTRFVRTGNGGDGYNRKSSSTSTLDGEQLSCERSHTVIANGDLKKSSSDYDC